MQSYEKMVIEYIRANAVMRSCDIERLGVNRACISKLCKEGVIYRLSRGVYTIPEFIDTEHFSLLGISKSSPNAVVCLISALHFHGLTTEIPHEVWLAVKSKNRPPSISYPPVNSTSFSEESFLFGVEKHLVKNITIKVYSVAKTIADCFKFRNKVGLDVAISALSEAVKNKVPVSDIMKAAKICRVSNVIMPYLEAVI